MKGMRDKDGNPLPNAHLQGLFSRVCKLLFYSIKPVFVFDGGVPVLKKQTVAARKERKAEAERESNDIAQKLLRNLVQSNAVKQALSGTSKPPRRVPGVVGRNQEKDIFELAPLQESEEIGLTLNAEEWERDFEQQEKWIRMSHLGSPNHQVAHFGSTPQDDEAKQELIMDCDLTREYQIKISALAAQHGMPCEDKNVYCTEWALKGECTANPGYMQVNCRKSCLWCNMKQKDVNNTTSTVNKNCTDENISCLSWAELGECNKNSGYMKSHCKHSCGVC
ncbi:DNA repair protein [Bulinus truncatus]|nr:DNA repair protein [Bulinus truncatus]